MANNLKELDVDILLEEHEVSGDVNIHIAEITSSESRNIVMVDQGGINQWAPDYEGSYTVTPTQSTQTLPTADKNLAYDITVNPIPSNYGLITWNGSVLTVS